MLNGVTIAQTKYTISGYVKDASSAEALPGAVVAPVGASKGAITNAYGFYSLELPRGDYSLTYSYLGYESDTLASVSKASVTVTSPRRSQNQMLFDHSL